MRWACLAWGTGTPREGWAGPVSCPHHDGFQRFGDQRLRQADVELVALLPEYGNQLLRPDPGGLGRQDSNHQRECCLRAFWRAGCHLPFFMLVRKGAKQKATPSAQVQILTEAKRGLRAIPLLAIVAGHMAVHILLYFELSHVSMRLLGSRSAAGKGQPFMCLGMSWVPLVFVQPVPASGTRKNTWQLR